MPSSGVALHHFMTCKCVQNIKLSSDDMLFSNVCVCVCVCKLIKMQTLV